MSEWIVAESGMIVCELVRCKDCKWSYDAIGGTFCSHGVCVDCVVYDDWFCADGERKVATVKNEDNKTSGDVKDAERNNTIR